MKPFNEASFNEAALAVLAIDFAFVALVVLWLWVLIWRRDLWLKYLAAEARFSSLLHMPSGLIAASRKFQEGRGVIYFAFVALAVSVLFVGLTLNLWLRAQTK